MRSITFAFRRFAAVLVLLVAALNVDWIWHYDVPRSTVPQPITPMLLMGPAYFGNWYVRPWWQTPLAVAVGILGLALAAVVYPRLSASSSESWVKGFRTMSVFQKPLPARTDA